MSHALHLSHQAFDEMDVFLLPGIDALAQRRWQRMILMQHNRNLAITRAENDVNMQPYQRTKPRFGISDSARGSQDALLGDLHCVVHDLEENFVLALKVMIETALAELECGGDIVHRGRIVSALLEEAGGGSQDFLPGINQGLARHRVSW